MDRFTVGATVPCSVRCQVFNDTTEVWVDTDFDAAFPTVTIYSPAGVALVSGAVLTDVGVGKARYLYTTTALAKGFYKRVYKGQYTSGGEVHKPILVDGFWLE